ncbi:uncharacterized protein LOC134820355 isoform X3 [Bolinopsis microptera]|uniref:uncharacterized protein LOC134820355 isoform X3 n=1 Tax=Bolinopsis microptera TaxID=2820187 RepID=UPI00307A4063
MVAPGDAFQQYFWGDKNAGYDVLLTNMKQAVSASKEFHEILRERGNYEEAFSKSLRRLSEKATTINAVGSFLPVWTVVKKYMENMSKIHGDFSTKFKELCQELNTFKTDSTSKTNKMLKDQADVVKTAAALNNIKNSLEHVNKCKKLYQQKHKDLIESEESFTKAGLAADKTDKETEKMQQKFTRSQDAFVLAENTYKASVEKYNKAQEEYNEDMTNSCKFFGEMEQTHLNLIVEFAKRFGDIETDLIEELKKNCESILGGDNDEDIKGLVGYTPEHLIKIFVEEKTTGVEMCPLMETELLTVKDPPVLSMTPKPTHNPAPHEKSSDSGSVNSIPNAHNATTVTTASVVPPANMNSMTLAMSNVNVGLKQFRKMIKPKKKPKNKNEGDNKSIDSKTEDHENGGDDISEKSTSEHDSAGHRSELDFYERHGTGYFSSDEDEGVGDDDSDEDGLTAKVRTIKIRNTAEVGGTLELPTEEELRKATEKLTLSCLSPNTLHRDRSKTHNPQLFSGRSGSFRGLPRPRSAVFSTRVRTSSDTTHLTITSSQTSLPTETSIQTQASSGISMRSSSKSSLLFSPRHSQVSASTPEFIQSSEICSTSSTSMSSLSMTSLSMFYLEIAEPEIETKHKEEHVRVATMADASSQSFRSSELDICPEPSLPEDDYNSSTRNAQALPHITISTLKNKRSKKKKTWDKILKVKSFCSESHVTLRQKILRKQHFEAKVVKKCPIYSPCTELKKAYSHSLVDLPVSPEPAPKTTFPTTFNTPRAKSVSGHISSPRAHPRNFPAAETNSGGGSDAWAVFDDSFKTSPKRASDSAALDSAASWSTPPTTKRILFEEHKIEQEKVPEKDDGLDGLLEFAPTNLNTPEKAEGNRNLDDLLSITLDDQRAMSPASEYMQEGRGSVYRYPHLRVDGTPTLSEVLAKKQTPDGSPTNSESNPNILVSDETGDMKDGDKVELDEETGARRKRLPSLIEFSPVKPLLIKLWWDRAASKRQSTTESPTSPPPDKSSSSPSPEREITPSPEREMSPPPETPPAGTSRMRKAFERNKMTGTFFRKKSKNKAPAPPPPESQEASDPLSSTHRSEEDIVVDAADPDTSLSPSNSIDTDSGVAVDGSMPPTLLAISNNDIDVEDSKLLSPLSVDSMSKVSLDSYDAQTDKPNGLIPKLKPTYATVTSPPVIPYLTKPASTEDVEFSAQHEETVENDREEIPYPIAIAIIETASAVFKPNDECTSKIEGELIMSLPCDAAADLAINPAPPPLKIRLVSTTTPNSFIVNRQIFSIKPPSILDILEVNMNLLQNFLKKRLEQIGKQQRINIPLLKYKSPYLKAELAPLIAQSYWTTSGDNTVLSIDASVNESLAVQNFHFPRITYSNSFDSSTPVLSSHPSAEISNNKLRWERYDVGNEMLDHPDRLIATFEVIPNLEGSRTDIEFEVEGVVISGTDVVLENSESYSIATTVKKMKSDKYWTEPKIMDSNC